MICEDECLEDLDNEREGECQPEGDFTGSDGCQILVDPLLLDSSSAQMVAMLESLPDSAERDSALLLDHDLLGMSLAR